MSEHVPFSQQHLEAQFAKAASRRLDSLRKSGAAKPGEADGQPDRKVSFRGWPKTNVEMWEGKPITAVAKMADAGGPSTGMIRAADHLLARMAVDKERGQKRQPEQKPTAKWSFYPHHAQVVEGRWQGRWYVGKVLDWGPSGVKVATEEGVLLVPWDSVKPVSPRRVEVARLKELAEQEKIGEDQNRYSRGDVLPGTVVTCVPKHEQGGDGEETKGVVLACVFDRTGHHIVIRDGKNQDHVFRTEDVVMVHRPEDLP